MDKNEKILISDIKRLLIGLKPNIAKRDRCSDDKDDTKPGILVTIGAEMTEDGVSWNYQTGDNSFSGGAYGFRHWATIYLYRRSNCTALAMDAASELMDLIASDVE